MELHGELEVFEERVFLFFECGVGGLLSVHHLSCLSEDPGISDAATCDGDGFDAGEFEHGEDVVDGPDVAGSEDDFLGVSLDEFGEE